MPEIPDNSDSSDLTRIEPSEENALIALSVSADLLNSASTRLGSGDYEGAMEDSRNSVRMAISSLLYKDGFVAATMEGMIYYLQKNYSGIFPLEDWQVMEKIAHSSEGSLTQKLKELLKIKKKYSETFGSKKLNSETAVKTAEKFVYAVKYIFEASAEAEMESANEPELPKDSSEE
jgi:uncharacterized protein (UPF0332 family)